MEPEEKYKKPEDDFLDLPDLEFEKPPISKICCPSCDGEIPGAHLNINDKIAKCESCNVVFPFTSMIQGLDVVPQKMKQEILRPEGIELFYYKDDLEMSFRRLFSPGDIIMSTLGLQASFAAIMIAAESGASLMGTLFAWMPLAFLIFFVIQRIRQKLYINISNQKLALYSKPSFMTKTKVFQVADIKQVYVNKSNKSTYWEVMMIKDEGRGQKHIKLAQLKSATKAKFIEQEIENQLGIQDVVVPGESN